MRNIIAISIFMLLLLLSSCKTPAPITIEKAVHDTCYVERLKHDSIYQRDSIYLREYIQGDTIIRECDRWHVKYKEVAKHDSIYLHDVDTVYQTKIVEKEKPMTWRDYVRTILYMAAVALIIFLIYVKTKICKL